MMSDTTREPRPRAATPEICREVAEQLHASILTAGLLDGDPEEEIADIASALLRHQNADGYQLARFLETSRSWECDFQIAEALDSARSLLDDAVLAAQRAWAERTDLPEPLAFGTHVRLPRSAETGVITGLCQHQPAAYLVKIDGAAAHEPPSNRRRIVYFEDAEPC